MTMNRTTTAGWSALAFVASVVGLNIVENVGTRRPDPTASADEIAEWAVDADAYLWATTLLVPMAWVFLTIFAATLWAEARARGLDPFDPLLGALGAAMTMGTLSAAVAADAVMIATVDRLGIDVIEALSRFASVLFLFNWVALAIALYGLSRTTVAFGLTPRWLDRLSLAGSVALLIGALQSGLILNDVLPGILIGLAGFLAWLLYLSVTGLRLTRPFDQVATPLDDELPTAVN
jgi:hypothetical protein